MKIIEQLYFGNISEETRRCSNKSKELRRVEESKYDLLVGQFDSEHIKLIDEFVDAIMDRVSQDILETYINAFKVGLNIGLEAGDIEL
ncbi:MAG: DUF6809 family protein [Christensenellales bacterium]